MCGLHNIVALCRAYDSSIRPQKYTLAIVEVKLIDMCKVIA
jgi:hypothetical protein